MSKTELNRKMNREVACRIGWHDWQYSIEIPPIGTHYISQCDDCGKWQAWSVSHGAWLKTRGQNEQA